MAALSAAVSRRLRATERLATQVVNASVLYRGSFTALGASHHATSANRGRAYPYNDEAGAIFWGLNQGGGGSGTSQGEDTVTGTGTAVNMVSTVMEEFVVEAMAPTGASAATDVGKLVFLGDDNLPTLTRPTVGCPVGIIVNFRSTTSFDVMFFSVATVIAIVLAGAGRDILPFGNLDWVSIADGDVVTNMVAPYGGAIVKFFAIIDVALTGTSGTTTLNMEIGTTDVGPTTPTTIVLSTAATPTKGQVVASAAISANNRFAEGDNLSVEAASTATTRTTGRFNFFALIDRNAGL